MIFKRVKLGGKEGAGGRGDVCTIMADLHYFMAETNTALQFFKSN